MPVLRFSGRRRRRVQRQILAPVPRSIHGRSRLDHLVAAVSRARLCRCFAGRSALRGLYDIITCRTAFARGPYERRVFVIAAGRTVTRVDYCSRRAKRLNKTAVLFDRSRRKIYRRRRWARNVYDGNNYKVGDFSNRINRDVNIITYTRGEHTGKLVHARTHKHTRTIVSVDEPERTRQSLPFRPPGSPTARQREKPSYSPRSMGRRRRLCASLAAHECA